MTKKDFIKWAMTSQVQQVRKFKYARIAAELTQCELGDKLKDYGYKGGRCSVSKWESGLTKIPPLVYELIFEGFAERTGESK